jgi:hypothetical protein
MTVIIDTLVMNYIFLGIMEELIVLAVYLLSIVSICSARGDTMVFHRLSSYSTS